MHQVTTERVYSKEISYYVQSRIVGKIGEIIFNPPSLMLNNANEITVKKNYDNNNHTILSRQIREKFGLVFSQITYFEPIKDHEEFLENDERVKG